MDVCCPFLHSPEFILLSFQLGWTAPSTPDPLWAETVCWSPKSKSNHTLFFLHNKHQASASIVVIQNKENFSSSLIARGGHVTKFWPSYVIQDFPGASDSKASAYNAGDPYNVNSFMYNFFIKKKKKRRYALRPSTTSASCRSSM